MPKIEDFNKSKKKFHKRRLRAWNILDIENVNAEGDDIHENREDFLDNELGSKKEGAKAGELSGDLGITLEHELDNKKETKKDSDLKALLDAQLHSKLGINKDNKIESKSVNIFTKEFSSKLVDNLSKTIAYARLDNELGSKKEGAKAGELSVDLGITLEHELDNKKETKKDSDLKALLDAQLHGKLGINKDNKIESNIEQNAEVVAQEYSFGSSLKNETNNEIYDKLYKSLYTSFKQKNLPVSSTENEQIFNLKHLSGEQLKILAKIVSLCDIGGKTGFLDYSDFQDCTKTKMTFKSNIIRLVKKSLIHREKGRRGVSGYFSFSVPEIVLNNFRCPAPL